VGAAVGGSFGGLLLVGAAGAGAAALYSRRKAAGRLIGPRATAAPAEATNPLDRALKGAATPLEQRTAEASSATISWQRFVDGDDVWFVSSAGETLWELPEGAVAVDAVLA